MASRTINLVEDKIEIVVNEYLGIKNDAPPTEINGMLNYILFEFWIMFEPIIFLKYWLLTIVIIFNLMVFYYFVWML